jgi:hypothetical protein
MENETTTAELLGALAVALPHHPKMPPSTLRLYLRDLEPIPIAVLADAITWMIRTVPMERRLPSVREIREACAERVLQLPSEAQALEQITARIAWARTSEGDPPAVHELVEAALDQVGGYHAFRTTDEPGVIRGQFSRIYRGMREDTMRRCQASPALGTQPAIAAA